MNNLGEPKICVEGLTKVFGREPELALQMLQAGKSKEEVLAETGMTIGIYDLSFAIMPQEVFVVMGLSGSGKSTLIRCLNRLIKPTKGSILVDGEDVVAMDDTSLRQFRREKISMVFQNFSLFPHLNVIDNVTYGLRVCGIDKEEQRERGLKILETVGLLEYAESRIQQLSGGMQQRIGLARALATDPDILLMDEPFSALDPLIRREMQDELIRLQQQLAKTIVFVTHDLEEALKLGDRIAVMKDGVIHQIGTPEEILRYPATDYVAEFVAGVNNWSVITAAHIMLQPDVVLRVGESPKVALQRMKGAGVSCIFVVDGGNRFKGILTAEEAAKVAKGELKMSAALGKGDIITIAPDMTLQELVPLGANARYPIPVLDDDQRLLGIVIRAAILNGLAKQYSGAEREEKGA